MAGDLTEFITAFNEIGTPNGFPVGNFSIAGEVRENGRLFSRIYFNPPVLGKWLDEVGYGNLFIKAGDTILPLDKLERVSFKRVWPEAHFQFGWENIFITLHSFAPLAIRNPFITSIPALISEIKVENKSCQDKKISLIFILNPAQLLKQEWADKNFRARNGFVGSSSICIGFTQGKGRAFTSPDILSALQGKNGEGQILVAETTLYLKGGEEAENTLILALYHPNGFYAEHFSSIEELASFIVRQKNSLRTQTEHFISCIPRTGDRKLDEYLRWYMFAGVILTRLTRDAVLTMGYRELNQRDSYWTSWQHLVFWPTLERKMIEESASHQRDNGKIPTTILPLIEREDDLDINEYFILRASRYYKWSRDEDFLKQIYPSVVKAYKYLASRDKDGDGLLEQKSFWGDWKDVPGVQGRKYSPYAQLLWLAVLRELRFLAEQLGDTTIAHECTKTFELAFSTLNKPVESGGLWNGKYYVNVWYDKHEDNHLLEDQTVGAVFGVIPPQHLASIYKSLKANERSWGVRETFPYYDEESFGIRGGDYHNGAVWPYLNFVDAFGRFLNGYSDDAIRILKNVGYWDLEKFGDYLPHENLDGETGQNTHAAIQGWDAAYFGAIYFGALGIERLAKDLIQITPRVSVKKPLKTFFSLPEGEIMLSIIPHKDGDRIELTSYIEKLLKVSFKTPDGHTFNITLPPNKTISLTLR